MSQFTSFEVHILSAANYRGVSTYLSFYHTLLSIEVQLSEQAS